MTLQMVRFTTSSSNVPEIEKAIESMMAAIQNAQPQGVRYAVTRLADGVTFHLFLELADGVENPLASIPEARAFQQKMPTWAVEPSAAQPVIVLGSYRLFT